jgi:hypothetical protein
MRAPKKESASDTVFMGLRVSTEVHKRLYRAKARLELSTGKFYGMGRLLDRVLKIGLSKIEKDLGSSSATSATV